MNAAVAWSVLAIILIAVYITWTAGRLDRMHARVDAAWAALDAQLVRRSAAARALGVLSVTRAADEALDATPERRQDVENDLTRALRAAWASLPEGAPRDELEAAASRVALARSFHNGAVTNARTLRRNRLVQLLRLSGHRELPEFFDVDETGFSDEEPGPLT
ncbi:MAG: rane protein [Frankiales bacterium]|nr:rane protein [Frankiales bacterium]